MNVPIKNAGLEYIYGLELSRTDDEVLAIAPGAARDDTNVNDIEVVSALAVSNVLPGAGGLDTGSVAANTWYAVYVIGDSLGKESVAGLLSVSLTDPTMPAGYDMKKKIGHVLTDASSDFLAFSQLGSGSQRQYLWEVIEPVVVVAAASMPTTLTSQSLILGMPAIRAEAILDVLYTPASATNVLSFAPDETAATTVGAVRMGYGVAGAQAATVRCMASLASSLPSIKYESSNAGDAMTLGVAGWVEDLLG